MTLFVLGILNQLGQFNVIAIAAGSFLTPLSLFVLFLTLQKKHSLSFSQPIFEIVDENPHFFDILDSKEFNNVSVNVATIGQIEWFQSDDIYKYLEYLDVTQKYPKLVIPIDESPISIDGIDHLFLDPLKAQQKSADQKIWAIPILVTENHWTLILIDQAKKSIEYYDSKVNYGNYGSIKKRLEKLAVEMTEYDGSGVSYHVQEKIHVNLQPDAYQCGPWILFFLIKRLENQNINFNKMDIDEAQSIIEKFRNHVSPYIFKMKTLYLKTIEIEIQRFRQKYGSQYSIYLDKARMMYSGDYNRNCVNGKMIVKGRIDPRKRWQDIIAGQLLTP